MNIPTDPTRKCAWCKASLVIGCNQVDGLMEDRCGSPPSLAGAVCPNMVAIVMRNAGQHVPAPDPVGDYIWEIPYEYKGAALNESPRDASQREAQDQLRAIIDRVANHSENRGKGALLAGPSRCGKTRVAIAALNYARTLGLSCVFAPTTTLMRLAFDRRNAGDAWETDLRMSSVVVIDDVGAERENEVARATLLDVVMERTNNRRCTIATTNLTAPEFARNPDWLRIATRLAEHGADCLIRWPRPAESRVSA